jgi:hypothetical protein
MADPQTAQPYEPDSTSSQAQRPALVATSPAIGTPYVHHRSFLGDIVAGALFGDFARDLRVPGAVTQIILSFIPLIGSMCAVRDLIADLRHHDRTGAFLNVLALAPILGGFSKTLEVVRSFAHVSHAIRITQHQREQQREQRNQQQANLPSRPSR